LLQVDSSGLRQLSLEQDTNDEGSEIERREAEEAEMAAAMQEVERLRLQMQRAAETTEVAEGVDDEGTIVKRKKKRKPKSATSAGATEHMGVDEPSVEGEAVRKKKKKKKRPKEEATEEA
jgi:AP-3 complex subunit delta